MFNLGLAVLLTCLQQPQIRSLRSIYYKVLFELFDISRHPTTFICQLELDCSEEEFCNVPKNIKRQINIPRRKNLHYN